MESLDGMAKENKNIIKDAKDKYCTSSITILEMDYVILGRYK